MQIPLVKLIRIMKLTAIILLIACLQLSAKSYSQRVTLDLKDASLETLFKEIRKQTGFQFLYDKYAIKDAGKITLQVTNIPVEEALARGLATTGFAYKIIEHTIILSPKQAAAAEPATPAQMPIELKGKVLDEKGAPLGGVNIVIKNSSVIVTTNNDGSFALTVPDDKAVLIISFVGYKTREIAVGRQVDITVDMQPDVDELNEVVAIGYGSIEKRRLTSSVATVKSADIKNLPVSSFDQMLQGLASGVFVNNNSGAPGKQPYITIRGVNSINVGDPLFVIDGTPVISQSLGTSFGVDNRLNPLTGLNPSDIASIEILKDAGAAAIYGSRAANGVVLITTKRGKEGKTTFTIDGYQGAGIPTGRLSLLNTTDYITIRREGFKNDFPNDPLPADLQTPDSVTNTDWQDLIYKPTSIGEYKVAMSGGTRQSKFYLSAGYRKETNPLSGKKGLERGTFRINLDHQATKKLLITTSIGISRDVNQNTADAATSYSPVDAAILAAPNLTPYDANGNFTVIPLPYGVGNPLAIFKAKIWSATTQLKGSLSLHYEIWNGLSFHTDLGYDYNSLSAKVFFPKDVNSVLQNTLFDGSLFTNHTNGYSIEPQFRYDHTFVDHQFSAVAGSTFQKRTTILSNIYGKGFPSDDLQEMSSAATTDGSSSTIQYAFNSVFGRLNYSYRTKYIAAATFRRDGSSRFGPGNKYGNFWSVSGGWLFSREDLFKNSSWLSLGKLRSSYGIVGSDAIADFTYLDQYQPVSYGNLPGVRPISAENPNVQWERTAKFDAGVDLGFFNSRLNVTVNYFRNKTDNLLVTKTLPSQTGYTSVQDNLPAVVINRGVEVEVQALAVKSKEFQWTVKLNITQEKNTLTKFPGLDSNDNFYKLNYKIGQSLNLLWGYKFLGIDQATGTPIYDGYNLDGTKKNPNDPYAGRQIIGKYAADYYGGIVNSFTYKGITLDVFLQFVQGVDRFNSLYDLDNSGSTTSNQVSSVLNRWRKPGDVTNTPRAATSSTAWWVSSSVDRQSSRFISDASYLRVKNITLSYLFPASTLKSLHIQQLRVFATGQNLVTRTKFTGIDPETGGNVAPVKMLTGGINVTL